MPDSGSWVRRLSPSAPVEEFEPDCLPETWNRTVAAIGVGPAAWVVELSDSLAPLALDPEIGPARRDEALAEVRPTTQAVVMQALVALDQGLPVPTSVPPETAVQIARAVRRRVPVATILKYQRTSHAYLSDVLVEACRQLVPPEEQTQQLSQLSRLLVDHVSGFSLACTAAFIVEEQSWLASIDGSRGELVRSLLAGEPPAGDPSKTLRYDLSNRTHVGLVLRREARDDDASHEALARVAAALLTRIGATGQLVIPADEHEVWAWGSFVNPRDADVRSIGSSPDTLVAVGRPASGLEGFRSTHENAGTAARVALLANAPHSRDRTVFFDDVRLTALLMADPVAAARFVQDELGALRGPREAVLRETVRVYLECNCSPASAATRLNVVKNTVVYRIRRAEELLGRSVKEQQGMLWSALHLAETFDLADASHPA